MTRQSGWSRAEGSVHAWGIHAGPDQFHAVVSVTESAPAGHAARDGYRVLAEVLAREGLVPVHERIFGSLTCREAVVRAREEALRAGGVAGGPFTYVEGRPVWGEGFAGVQLFAVRPEGPIEDVEFAGLPCGRVWRHRGARYAVLHSVHGGDGSAAPQDRGRQAFQMFRNAQRLLRDCGFDYRNVVTTWIYVSAILEWYDVLNAARNEAYGQFGLFERDEQGRPHLPASTGIYGENPFGAACVMDLLALVPSQEGLPRVRWLSNRKQNEAYEYGSAFSRGAAIEDRHVRHIQVSGTAAIDENGNSLFPDDPAAQVARTLETVESLIEPEGADLGDVCEATMFLKRPQDLDALQQVLKARSLEDLPAVRVIGDVCRPELLFEMDAVVAVPL